MLLLATFAGQASLVTGCSGMEEAPRASTNQNPDQQQKSSAEKFEKSQAGSEEDGVVDDGGEPQAPDGSDPQSPDPGNPSPESPGPEVPGPESPGPQDPAPEPQNPAPPTIRRNASGDQHAAFVEGLYRGFLGRPSDLAGRSEFLSLLTVDGTYATITDVLVGTPEFRRHAVAGLYSTYLGRAAGSTEIESLITVSGGYGGGAFGSLRVILLSSEFTTHGGVLANKTGATDTEKFVRGLYLTMLHAPSDAEVAYWVGQIGGGVTKAQVLDVFMATDEFRVKVITKAYQDLLGRAPSGSESDAKKPLLAGGQSMEDFYTALATGDSVATEIIGRFKAEVSARASEGATVHSCPGLNALANTTQAAGGVLQDCINQTPEGDVLELPFATFAMERGMVLAKPITIRTSGSKDKAPCYDSNGQRSQTPCAMLISNADMYSKGGLLNAGATQGVVVDHVILNGNRSARLSSAAASDCLGGGNRITGFNALVHDCSDCSFNGGASLHGLCASGFGVSGTVGFQLKDNYIAFNGSSSYVSDGATLGTAEGSIVSGNVISDNSDVNLIFFSGKDVKVHGNRILNTGVTKSFAGIMLDNNGSNSEGMSDFTGADIYDNVVDCNASGTPGYFGCDIGIQVGPYAWYSKTIMPTGQTGLATPHIIGAVVRSNTVRHAKQGLNLAGAGTVQVPVKVDSSNTVSDWSVGSAAGFFDGRNMYFNGGSSSCSPGGVQATSAFNADPGSVVNAVANQPTWSANAFRNCW